MLLYQLGALLLLLAVCGFAPGFFFVRKLRWNPLEKLCASIALSWILVFLASWAIYCAGARGKEMPVHPAPYCAVSLVCAILAAICWRDIRGLLRAATVRRALAGYGVVLLWTALLAVIIRNFSGAVWFSDWLEHFQRSLFFLHHFPADTEIFPGYALPARPPMMNVLAAFFLAQTTDRFEIFQAFFLVANTLLFLACYLAMPALGRRARRRTWLLVLFFAASPLVMQNATYTWTKAAAAFFVVLALWFYLTGWRKGDSGRILAAFISLAAGLLAHYSAGPYIAIFTLHYLIVILPKRPHKWRELAAITAVCGLLVGVWLGWSIVVYGPHITFLSNSTVTSSQKAEGSTAVKIAANLFDSLVPLVIRQPDLLSYFSGQRTAGMVRDWFFVFYQLNVVFGMGLVGGPLALWFAWRALRRRRAPETTRAARLKRPKGPPAKATPEQIFWRIFIAAGVVLGIAVVGERDPLGVAHLTLLSLQALGLTMLAAALPLRKALLVVVLIGCTVDFSFGVLLHAHVESLDNTAASAVFPGMVFTGNAVHWSTPGPDALSGSAFNNWFIKHQRSVYDMWLRDLDRQYGSDPAFQAIAPQIRASSAKAAQDDAARWQGWFGRHNGEVQLLGDHTAAWSGLAQVLLTALFVGLGAAVWRGARSAPSPAGSPKTRARRPH